MAYRVASITTVYASLSAWLLCPDLELTLRCRGSLIDTSDGRRASRWDIFDSWSCWRRGLKTSRSHSRKSPFQLTFKPLIQDNHPHNSIQRLLEAAASSSYIKATNHLSPSFSPMLFAIIATTIRRPGWALFFRDVTMISMPSAQVTTDLGSLPHNNTFNWLRNCLVANPLFSRSWCSLICWIHAACGRRI